MEIAKIVCVGIIAGILAVTIKKTNPELAMQVSIAAGVILIAMLLSYLSSAVSFIKDFVAKYQTLYNGILVVIKVVGIAYLCEFAVQVLKDAGEGAIASKVEMGGKVIIMVMTLPLLANFAELILSFV